MKEGVSRKRIGKKYYIVLVENNKIISKRKWSPKTISVSQAQTYYSTNKTLYREKYRNRENYSHVELRSDFSAKPKLSRDAGRQGFMGITEIRAANREWISGRSRKYYDAKDKQKAINESFEHAVIRWDAAANTEDGHYRDYSTAFNAYKTTRPTTRQGVESFYPK